MTPWIYSTLEALAYEKEYHLLAGMDLEGADAEEAQEMRDYMAAALSKARTAVDTVLNAGGGSPHIVHARLLKGRLDQIQ